MANKSVASGELVTPEFMAELDFGAAITDAQMSALIEGNRGFDLNQNLCLAMLSRSKQQLMERVVSPTDGAKLYLEMLEGIENYKGKLQHWKEQAEIAEMRVMCMLAALNERINASPETA